MKRMLSLLCAVAMLFALAGCGAKEQPDVVVSKFCDAMKTFDLETMRSYIAEHGDEPLEMNNEDFPESVYDILVENASDITYTVNSTTVADESGTVTVGFTYPDISATIAAAMGEYLTQAFGLALSGADDDTLENLFEQILIEQLTSAQPQTAEDSLMFGCVMTENGWMIEDISDPELLLNIMTGNMMAGFDGLDEDSESDDEYGEDELVWHDVAVGEEVQLATLKMKVTDCWEDTTIQGEWDTLSANEGSKYVVYTISFENTTKEPIELTGSDFPFYDSQDRAYSADDDAMFSVDNALLYRELAPNMPETGVIVYNVPADSQDYYLVMGKAGTPDMFCFFGK